MADQSWEDSLILLHENGWETDDIDAACDALVEACTEGDFEGSEPSELDDAQLASILGSDATAAERKAIVHLTEVRAQEDPEAEALTEALWDIEDFADSR